ncbi:MAG: SsrA-binding protein SmpB [Bacteroidales bacterium]|nr:SsrA-binding protein SmpB [Bacteroidales bacterium]
MKEKQQNIRIKNKKAAYQYFILDKFSAGICLTGTEIKSIRSGRVSLGEAFCVFEGDELFLRGAHIAEYEYGTYSNHDPKRDRKLLLTRRELKKLQNKVKEKGLTIIPVEMYINEQGFAKVDIALARGKHYYDKRETLKKNDAQRDIDRRD